MDASIKKPSNAIAPANANKRKPDAKVNISNKGNLNIENWVYQNLANQANTKTHADIHKSFYKAFNFCLLYFHCLHSFGFLLTRFHPAFEAPRQNQ